MIFIKLFLVFLRIGLFAVGGAYSFFPLIEKEMVEKYHWLTKEEFLNILGLTQVFPGAISIKYATYIGYKMGGVIGVILANLGNILAPMLLIIFASVFYAKFSSLTAVKNAFDAVRLSVFAMIIAVAFQAVNIANLIHPKSLLIIIVSFVVFIYTKINPALIIILAGLLGIIWR